MTDSQFYIQKKRIRCMLDRWTKSMSVSWAIDINYSREPLHNTSTEGSSAWTTLGQADPKWEYNRATLHFDLQALADFDNEAVERVVVHELCHIMVNEMRMWGATDMTSEKRDEAFKHEERVVSGMTAAFLNTRRRCLNDGRTEERQKYKEHNKRKIVEFPVTVIATEPISQPAIISV